MAFNPTLKHLTTRLDGGVIWAASTEYLADNIVIFQNASYRCLVNHTSSASFTTDLNSNRWAKLNNEINYILNGNALVDTSGWSTYADAAGTQPVDGAGGSPNVTFTRSTTTPLRGIADFNFAKDAANRQGQGVATDFVIDLADQAKVLTVSFDYEVLSGTYVDSDLTVYLIADPTGTPVVIQPAGYVVQAATVGTKMRQIATFQTQASGQSYRLCLHVASTSASAYTLAVDNVVVGPQVVQYGAPVTDWVDFPSVTAGTLITGSTSNPTYGTVAVNEAKYRRVGDSWEIRWDYRQNAAGSSGSGTYYFNLPAGVTIDLNKVGGENGTAQAIVGVGRLLINVSVYDFTVHVDNANRFYLDVQDAVATGIGWNSSFGGFNSTALRVTFQALVPIAGLSSTVQMSQDTDTRVVSFVGNAGSGQVLTANTTNVSVTSVKDSHGSWSGSSYLVPVSGDYVVSGGVSTGVIQTIEVYRNGVLIPSASWSTARSANDTSGGSITVPNCVAGQILSIRSTVSGTVNQAYISISRLSGPSAIAASESVNAIYNTNAGQSVAAALTTILYGIKIKDSHNAYSTGTGIYTVPVSGVYRVTASAYIITNTSVTQFFQVRAIQAGSVARTVVMGSVSSQNTTSNSYVPSGSTDLNCLAGDTIKIDFFNGTAAGNLQTDPAYNFMNICRVGN